MPLADFIFVVRWKLCSVGHLHMLQREFIFQLHRRLFACATSFVILLKDLGALEHRDCLLIIIIVGLELACCLLSKFLNLLLESSVCLQKLGVASCVPIVFLGFGWIKAFSLWRLVILEFLKLWAFLPVFSQASSPRDHSNLGCSDWEFSGVRLTQS